MALSVPLDLVPMESEAIDELPAEKGWQFEPKWDGFRALAFRDGDTVHLQSRNQKPLGRYFPELVDALHSLPVKRFVLDGEILILGHPFETLQLRLHPAATRIALLARQYPATFVAFDLLADVRGRSLLPQPFAKRREALEKFLGTVGETSSLMLSPATRDPEKAREWLHTIGDGLDGIVAKPLEAPYRPGERLMRKFKVRRSYDCVVAGLYFLRGTRIIDSVLLGLYDDQGLLHYVGRFRVTKDMDAAGMDKLLRPLSGGSGFTGRSPSGKNRWSGKEREAIPLKPVLVAEVTADHITSQHIRHGAKFVRWRGDKRPEACTLDQLERASAA
jgi:ATP-dependent DNA ligase